MNITQLTHLELSEIFSTFKKCPRCNIVKPIVEGYYASRPSECRTCRNEDLKKRRDKKKEENE